MNVNKKSWHYRLSSVLFNHRWTNSSCSYVSKVIFSLVLFVFLVPSYCLFSLPQIAAMLNSLYLYDSVFIGSIFKGTILEVPEAMGLVMSIATVVLVVGGLILLAVLGLSAFTLGLFEYGEKIISGNRLVEAIKNKKNGICTRVNFED